MRSPVWLLLGLCFGCRSEQEQASSIPIASAALESTATRGAATDSASVTAEPPTPSPAGAACPEGMQPIPGGRFFAGAPEPGGTVDEHPRHLTEVHAFCLDRTEVTTSAYEACVLRGQCQSARRDTFTCNAGRDRGGHPINCVSWHQADAYCKARGARLPTELEWEFAARGGAEYRAFSWGNDPPDGHTCWKQPRSCEVATHSEGAFGLHDMNGNLWEWTSTWYGPYPWPPPSGSAKVYRGGSWSRRFEKWLSPTLRNRQPPSEFGSHLGFRCATLQASTDCPYGKDAEGGCRHGVEEVACPAPEVWNGHRCATPGEQGCAPGTKSVPGHGCVGEGFAAPRSRPRRSSDEAGPVSERREPRFDADCARFQPKRPHAWRFEGGSHAARNGAGNGRGCKNRDVGVGWNSACCP